MCMKINIFLDECEHVNVLDMVWLNGEYNEKVKVTKM